MCHRFSLLVLFPRKAFQAQATHSNQPAQVLLLLFYFSNYQSSNCLQDACVGCLKVKVVLPPHCARVTPRQPPAHRTWHKWHFAGNTTLIFCWRHHEILLRWEQRCNAVLVVASERRVRHLCLNMFAHLLQRGCPVQPLHIPGNTNINCYFSPPGRLRCMGISHTAALLEDLTVLLKAVGHLQVFKCVPRLSTQFMGKQQSPTFFL